MGKLRAVKRFGFIVALSSIALGQQAPVNGVAGAQFHVGDLATAPEFSTKVFGFQEREEPPPESVIIRVNGEQYVEFSSEGPGDAKNPLEAIIFSSGAKTSRGLPMGPKDPYGRRTAVVTHNAADRFQPDGKGVSNHLLHVGMGSSSSLRGEQGSDHICFEAVDIQKTYRTLLERGARIGGKPRVASNGHWVINMLDTNGIRVDLTEPGVAAK